MTRIEEVVAAIRLLNRRPETCFIQRRSGYVFCGGGTVSVDEYAAIVAAFPVLAPPVVADAALKARWAAQRAADRQ